MREMLFVLLLLVPLCLAVPSAVSCRRRGARAHIMSALYACLIVLFVWLIAHPFSIGETYWHAGFVTTLSVGLYASLRHAHRPWQAIAWQIAIPLLGIIAMITLYTISEGYRDTTRNPYKAMRNSVRRQMVTALMEYAPGQIFPAGPITVDSPLLASVPAAERSDLNSALERWSFDYRISPRWHTWMTGLYRAEHIPLVLWYPGGKVAEVAEQMAWRESSGR